MIETRITRRHGISTPILNAGMAFVAGPELAAAVANAGGIGMLGAAMLPPDALRAAITATRSLTRGPLGVDLIGDFVESAHINALVAARPDIAVFFWTFPDRAALDRLKVAGIAVWMQVGSLEEARVALALGAETLIVQGSEAGGHNRSEATLANLLTSVRREWPAVPVVAAGGVIDGTTMAAALTLGADAVWCGTRFLATPESAAHADYKRRVIETRSGGTLRTTLFGPEWPGQMARVMTNQATRTGAGRETDALRDAEGEVIGTMTFCGVDLPVPRYSAMLPTRDFRGDIEWTCLTAGEAAANIGSLRPAGDLVAEMTAEAERILLGPLRAAAE